MRIVKMIPGCVLSLLRLAPATLSQTAGITDLVTDPSGAVLPGVTVWMVNQRTNIRNFVLAGDQGYYSFLRLSPSVYQLEAELPAFKRHVQADITLDVDQEARIDISMQLGQPTEVVHVLGEAPTLNSQNAAKGSVIYNQEIVDLPVESRDFSALVFLTVGAIPEPEGGQGGYAIRAGDAAVRPSMDAVQEFKVQTSNYSAEYGRRSTGVINVVLRSGTNNFHGSLFEFHRNSVFDARNFFDQEKSQLVRNDFGANLGGPVVRDKTFFFANYEGWYLREGVTRLERTPTLAEREGDFSSLLPGIKIKDPLTGKTFPNNLIPKTQFHPVSLRILEFFPLPNVQRGDFNYTSNRTDADDYHDCVVKLDHHFGHADSLSVRYLYNNRIINQPFNGSAFPGFGRRGPSKFLGAGINWTHTLTPRMINQLVFSFTRRNTLYTGYTQGTNYCARLGIDGCTQDPGLIGFPRVTIKGIGDIGEANGNPEEWTENDYDISNTVSLVKGLHNIRFGGQSVRTQFFELIPDHSRGFFNFQDRWTGAPMADFMMGYLNNTVRRIKVAKNYMFSTTWAAFVQDDWKLRRTLTLSYGMRRDYFSPPTEKRNNWSNFDPELGRLVLAGESGFPRSLVHATKANLAPRLGLAWKVRNNTVLRAGIGQFFGMSIQGPLNDSMGTSPPFSVRENYSRLASKPALLTWDSPFPQERLTVDGISSPTGYEGHPKAANMYQYSLTLEQELARDLVWEAGYVGSKGTHLGRRYNIKQTYFTKQPDGTVTSTRAFPGFSTIQSILAYYSGTPISPNIANADLALVRPFGRTGSAAVCCKIPRRKCGLRSVIFPGYRWGPTASEIPGAMSSTVPTGRSWIFR